MSRIARFAALALALAGATSALAACQALAGIEDRHYQPVVGDAGATGEGSPECVDYCNKTQSACATPADPSQTQATYLYITNDACLATCAHMPLTGAKQNSVACRMQQLGLAQTVMEGPELYCANAGPGGNGTCGTNCENYCSLFKAACTDDFNTTFAQDAAEGDDGTAVCIKKCLGLEDTGLFDSTKSATGNYFGDTIQCRLVHTCSSMLDAPTHCGHAALKSTEKCLDDPAAVPDCKKFCHLERTECADFPQYEDDAQCEAVCNALAPGHIGDGHTGDPSVNTVGCRMYHSYNSLLDPVTHCTHTGPGGDGHCFDGKDPDAGNCQSYCQLLEKGCQSEFDAKFEDQAACQAECVKIDGSVANSGFSTSAAGNNLQCRLLSISRALASPSNSTKFCAAALGGSPCK